MACTLRQLAAYLASRLGKEMGEGYICARRLREAGFAATGRGGRGGINSPPATTEQATLLLIALLLPEEPKRAVELAREYLGFVKFDARCWRAQGGVLLTEEAWLGDVPNNAGEGLARIINLYRRGGEGRALPLALRVGEMWGHRLLQVDTRALQPDQDGNATGATFTYAPSGTPVIPDSAVPVAGRSVMAEVGGDVFLEIAKLLGPLPASGGGELLVSEPGAELPHSANDFELPIAAAPAAAERRPAPLQ